MTRMIDLAHEAEWRDDGHRATSQRQPPAPAIALSQPAPSVPHADWSIGTRFVREDLVVGHMVGTRPGVVCPKSWRSGCEPATLETVPSHPYHLPCRARSELALGAGDDVGAGSLTDAAIQATESLLVGLAFFDLAVVVGPAVAVGWATRVRAPCARHGPACGCHAGTTGKPCTHLRKLQTVRQRCRPPRCPGRPHPSNPRRSR